MAAQAYVGKSIGARRLTWFPLITDPETGKATYGPPIRLSRLITITVTPVISEGLLISIHSPRTGRDSKNTQYKRAYFCKTQQIF